MLTIWITFNFVYRIAASGPVQEGMGAQNHQLQRESRVGCMRHGATRILGSRYYTCFRGWDIILVRKCAVCTGTNRGISLVKNSLLQEGVQRGSRQLGSSPTPFLSCSKRDKGGNEPVYGLTTKTGMKDLVFFLFSVSSRAHVERTSLCLWRQVYAAKEFSLGKILQGLQKLWIKMPCVLSDRFHSSLFISISLCICPWLCRTWLFKYVHVLQCW